MDNKCRSMFESLWCSGTTGAKHTVRWPQNGICGVVPGGRVLECEHPNRNSRKELLKQCQAFFGEEFSEACCLAAEADDSDEKPDNDFVPDDFVDALLDRHRAQLAFQSRPRSLNQNPKPKTLKL